MKQFPAPVFSMQGGQVCDKVTLTLIWHLQVFDVYCSWYQDVDSFFFSYLFVPFDKYIYDKQMLLHHTIV